MSYKLVKTFNLVDITQALDANSQKQVLLDVILELVKSEDHSIHDLLVIVNQHDVDQLCSFLKDTRYHCCLDWLLRKGFITMETETYPMGTVFRKTTSDKAGEISRPPYGMEYRVLRNPVDEEGRYFFMMERVNQIASRIKTGKQKQITAKQVSVLLNTDQWEVVKRNSISDGFGSTWENKCPKCGAEMEAVRPGKVQCSQCG